MLERPPVAVIVLVSLALSSISAPACDGADADTDDLAGETEVPVPWAGGAAYHAAWSNGPPSDPSVFPLAVWP